MKLISLAIVSLLMLSSVAVFSVRALPANSMWIEPSTLTFDTTTTPNGTTFDVTVWFNTTGATPGINNWQFYIVYNKIHLSYVSGQYTGTGNAKSAWSGALPTDNPPASSGDHNATYGYALWGEVLKASAELSTSGSLVKLTFQIIKPPGEGEVLSSLIVLDNTGIFSSSAADKDFNDIPLAFGKAIYTYSAPWTPPAPARIFVNPAVILNNSATPCHNFTIDVQIQSASLVSFFDFKLNFKPTVVKAWEAKLGNFFPPTATTIVNIDNTTGFVQVSATLAPSDPPANGNGILATIKFHVEANGSSSLTLSDIQLKDKSGHLLPFTSSNGYFTNSALLGDVNGDGKVDINDVARVSAAFGSYPGHPRWEEACDINRDGSVNILDLAIVCLNYGQPR